MELLLVRHARPHHIERAHEGADPDLTEVGRLQARAVAGWLATEEIDAVYTSPLARARQTADPLARLVALRPEVEDGVKELDAGSSSYVPVEVLRQDRERFGRLVAEHASPELAARAAHAVETLERIVGAHRGQRVVVVCHGGVINAWTAHVVGIDYRLFFDPDYTSINRYQASSTGVRSIVSLNERAHLRAAPGLLLSPA